MQETQETRVQSLGQEDPLEEGIAVHSNILACRNPWTEEPGGLQSMSSRRVELHKTEGTEPSCRKRNYILKKECFLSSITRVWRAATQCRSYPTPKVRETQVRR